MKTVHKMGIAMGCCLIGAGLILWAQLPPPKGLSQNYSGTYVWWEETIMPKAIFDQCKELEDQRNELLAKWDKVPVGVDVERRQQDEEQAVQLSEKVMALLADNNIEFPASFEKHHILSTERSMSAILPTQTPYPWDLIRPLDESDGVADYENKVAITGILPKTLRDQVPPDGALKTESASAEFRFVVDWQGASVDLDALSKEYVAEWYNGLSDYSKVEAVFRAHGEKLTADPIDVFFTQLHKKKFPFPKRVPEEIHREVRLLKPGDLDYRDAVTCDFYSPSGLVPPIPKLLLVAGIAFVTVAFIAHKQKV